MKKLIVVLLCLSFALCLTACGKATVAGNETTSVLLSESATVSEVDGGSLAYTTKVAYANTAGEGYARILSECLNAEGMYMSSVQHWPLFRFETAQEIQDFKTSFADALTFDRGYDEIPSFDSYAANYDDTFFSGNTLLLCYVTASSGSYRFGVADVSVRENTLCVYIKQLNHPQSYTADVQGWFVLVEVSKADIEHCTHFDAQTANTNVLDTVTADYDDDGEYTRYWGAEPEYRVCTYSNLTRKQGKEKTLSAEDNQTVTQLIERQEFGDPYDNLNDVILTDVLNEENIYYDSDAGIVTRGDFAVKLSDADREALNEILSRYVTLGVD